MKTIRIIGLMTAFSYLLCVLYTWMLAEINGNVYFSAGEPDPIIRYIEWGLGIISISVIISEIKIKLDADTKVIYDPPV